MKQQLEETSTQPIKLRVTVVSVLIVVNVFVWVFASYLWFNAGDMPPERTNDFVMAREIAIPLRSDAIDTQLSFSLQLIDTNLELASTHALLMNLNTGEVLFNHRGNEQAYPASITKIMTVLLGIIYSETETVVVHADFGALIGSGASMAGFVYGETRTLSVILHGSFLSSGADATTALAYHVAGSYQEFVDMMNAKARQLGMENTNFMNASGLHHEDQYTTAYDIALLVDYALNYSAFRAIFTRETYQFVDFWGNHHEMRSTMRRLMPVSYFHGGNILGGKVGFTNPAGLCFASIATNGANEFLLITFGAQPLYGINPHINDAFAIYEYFLNPEN